MSTNRLRVAFSSPEHARCALKFLAAFSQASMETSVRDPRELTVLEIDAAVAHPDHVSALARGTRGVMPASTQARTEVA